jgi:hypothetical protein
MVMAMVVLMVPVILIVGLYRFLGHDTPPTVDTASAYDAARAAHAFDVVTPTGLADGWHISTATYGSGTLRVGITSPKGGALQLVESSTPPATLLPAELGAAAKPDGTTVDVNGAAWQRYTGLRPQEKAIVLSTPGRTIVVVGKAGDSDLVTLASSLR